MDAMKLLKGLMGNQSLSSTLGKQLLGSLLGGGGQQQQASQTSGLASVLSGVLGGGNSGGSSAGASLMSGLMGSLLGGGGGGGGQAPPAAAQPTSGSALSKAAGMVSDAMDRGHVAAPADANDQAVLMIRAMVNAAKSDGRIDQSEQENIIGKLGNDVSEAEIEFLRKEFAAPLDVNGFASSIPRGLEHQIYAISLTSIELDTQNEANYLGQLAQGLNISPELCNQIHDQLDAPKIFG